MSTSELLRALAVLSEPPAREHARLIETLGLPGFTDDATYTDVFLFQLFPYASVYLGPEGQLGGEARDRVAGFYRALGVTPPPHPDQLSVLLGTYAQLVELEDRARNDGARERWRRCRAALLHEHLLPWVPVLTLRVRQLAPEPYRAWASLLDEALAAEVATVGEAARLPLHLREAAGLPDPRREGGAAFLAGLLAPVRAGFVLTRTDLARAAGDLGLGLRIGERRFVLRALLSQDAEDTLGWLAGFAADTARQHTTLWGVPPAVVDYWYQRAAGTAELLRAVSADAGSAVAGERNGLVPS